MAEGRYDVVVVLGGVGSLVGWEHGAAALRWGGYEQLVDRWIICLYCSHRNISYAVSRLK